MVDSTQEGGPVLEDTQLTAERLMQQAREREAAKPMTDEERARLELLTPYLIKETRIKDTQAAMELLLRTERSIVLLYPNEVPANPTSKYARFRRALLRGQPQLKEAIADGRTTQPGAREPHSAMMAKLANGGSDLLNVMLFSGITSEDLERAQLKPLAEELGAKDLGLPTGDAEIILYRYLGIMNFLTTQGGDSTAIDAGRIVPQMRLPINRLFTNSLLTSNHLDGGSSASGGGTPSRAA